MRWRALSVLLLACSAPSANVYPPRETLYGAAWQMFVVGPFRRVTASGNLTWPTGEEPPDWTHGARATLSMAARDVRVEFTTGPGLRHEDCALEIITGEHSGVRIARPAKVIAGPTGTTSIWTGAIDTDKPGHAAMFCPFDAAHRSPPWGVTIDVE
jgi:hypothetical protein